MYQLIIIGAGPAGLSAGLYAKRYGINFIIIGQILGGAVNEGHLVDNYLGFKSISGADLSKKFLEHLENKIREEQVKLICKENETAQIFKVQINKNEYRAQSLILGLGMKIRKLNIKNEEKFLNQGVSYYTPTDISLFKDKIIAVVGGGDSALTAALKTADQAKKVYLIHRRDEFRGTPGLAKKVKKKKNIELILSAQVKEVKGKDKLEKIVLDNQKELALDQLYIEIGGVPNVQLCQELNIKMENNFIVVDKNQATNVPGVFAAGDVTNNPLKQIITAAAEGAIAATSAYFYLKRLTE